MALVLPGTTTIAAPDDAPTPTRRKSTFLSAAVTAVIVPGLVATMALPAYAAPDAAEPLQRTAPVAAPQTFSASPDAVAAMASRDAFGATSIADLEAARAQEAAAAAAAATAAAAAAGPSVASLLANPPQPTFSLDAVVQVALQYQGVPYVFGGSDPSGFDCSGFVMYVYAQFGIALPHGVSGQASAGTPIAREAALPGDVVIMDGHDGIYMGNGQILDAPQPGEVVSVRPIWTDDYSIVRFGI